MQKIKALTVFVFLTFFSGNVFAQKATKINNLTVFSESGLAYPLVKIARVYSEQKHSILSINFDYSAQLIKNINEGEPADVFISSHPSWIETLKQNGLVDVYNLVNVAKDKLLIVVSKQNRKVDFTKIDPLADTGQILFELINQKVPIIVDSEKTSLGKYTKTILEGAHIPDQKVYHRIVEDKKSIIDSINESDEYCGIVLASSVKKYDNIKVVKEIENSEIYYQALVIAGDNMQKARDFLKFIKTEEIRNIFSESGFIID
ncbi:MAG: modA [Rickettsiaceae bacterium]|jgi:molybdenum ABC transporter molybdate-binding protein|nr:modA [Rickettsiaceae bacterium]